jgi:CubicO group peptidase (beta-lactamase class C family)
VKRTPRDVPNLCAARRALAIALLALAAACSSSPVASPVPESVTGTPGDGEGIAADGSEAAGVGPPPVLAPRPPEEEARYQLAAEYSAARSGHVLLILQAEEVVLEAGQNGHRAEEPHPLYSASESFWGLLAMAADSDGLLDIDEPVSFTIGEFEGHPWKRDMRIRQLLHGTSGLEPGVRALRPDETPNLYERAIALDMVSRPGERFQYGSGQLFVFAEVLRRKLASRSADPLDYLKERILDPIGLAVADWDRDDAGNPDVAFGAKLSAREWAKLGILLKNRGMWQGRTAVGAEAVAAVLQGSAASPEYGLALWRNVPRETAEADRSAAGPDRTFYPDGLPDMVVAAGVGNQRLYVIPSLDLVVVRFGEVDRHWRDQEFMRRLVDGAPE